jgi:DNA-binding response OmpR family regulator
MIKILSIDSTEDLLYYNSVSKLARPENVDHARSIDVAISRIKENHYDLITVSRTPGRLDLYDVADEIKKSVANRRTAVILFEDNPTLSTRFEIALSGRRVMRFKTTQVGDFEEVLKGVLQ